MDLKGAQDDVAEFDINQYPPVEDLSAGLHKRPYGVVKLKNIPYGVTSQEIRHFVGRVSSNKLIDDHTFGFPIHIIIERPTAKTLDCFLEFVSQEHAICCVNRAEQAYNRGKPPKIGQRHVRVVLSSQGELMSNLFPRANNVHWDITTGNPHVLPNHDPYSEGFRGFFTIEEMSSIVKHAETPQRSPFSARCMQRTYENMISTLYKFPWQSTRHYTVAARNYLYTTYMSQLDVLTAKVSPGESALVIYNTDIKLGGTYGGEREVGLSQILLKDLIGAGLNTPAFSMRQKHEICARAGQVGQLGLPLLAAVWPFEILSAPLETPLPDVVLERWMDILSKGLDVMHAKGLSTGYEHLINISRNAQGHVVFEFTQQAQALHFSEAIECEYAVMEQIMEKGRVKWCIEHKVSYEPLESIKADLQIASQLSSTMRNTGFARTSDDIRYFGSQSSFGAGPVIMHPSSYDLDRFTDNSFSHVLDSRTTTQYGSYTPSTAKGPLDPAAPASQDQPAQPEVTRGFHHTAYTIDPTTPEFVPSRQWAGNGAPLRTIHGFSAGNLESHAADLPNPHDTTSAVQQARVNNHGHSAAPAAVEKSVFTSKTGHDNSPQPYAGDQTSRPSLLDTSRAQAIHRRSITMATPEHLRSALRTTPRSAFTKAASNPSHSLTTSRTRRKTITVHSPIDEEHHDHPLDDGHNDTADAGSAAADEYAAEDGGVQIRSASQKNSVSHDNDDTDHDDDDIDDQTCTYRSHKLDLQLQFRPHSSSTNADEEGQLH